MSCQQGLNGGLRRAPPAPLQLLTLPMPLLILLAVPPVAWAADVASSCSGAVESGPAMEECGLLQSRKDAATGSCKMYGCIGYEPSHPCQCNPKCGDYGNCCPDHTSTCASCRGSGCGKYVASRSCQCNDLCVQFDDCCWDYQSTCAVITVSASCYSYGCGHYVKSQQCQCDDRCAEFGNCCSDYDSTCAVPAVSARAWKKVHGHPSTSKTYPTYAGFTLVLAEEFDHPLDLDSDPVWTWSDGGRLEGQVRFVKDAIKFEGGRMRIEVASAGPNSSGEVQACSHAEAAIFGPKMFSGGELRSRNNLFRYGLYEARVRAVAPGAARPAGAEDGAHVAAMRLFRDAKFVHWREIDLELKVGKNDTVLRTDMLSAEQTAEWLADISEEEDIKVTSDMHADFHTYAIAWLPDRITWYLDGKVFREKKGGGLPIPTLSTKVMLSAWPSDDLLLSAPPGGKETHDDVNGGAEYDWFRFYQWDGDMSYPCAGMGTQCLTLDDQYLSGNNPCDGIPTNDTIYGKAVCTAECL